MASLSDAAELHWSKTWYKELYLEWSSDFWSADPEVQFGLAFFSHKSFAVIYTPIEFETLNFYSFHHILMRVT